MKSIIKAYFKQYKALTSCKQFNKKVELNQKVKRFKDQHKITIVPTSSHNKQILVNAVHVATMKYNYEAHKRNGWEFNPKNYQLEFIN